MNNQQKNNNSSNNVGPGQPVIVTAALIVIGDEILSGRTHDKNIAYLANFCTEIGIQLKEVRVVGDIEEVIVEAVNSLRTSYDYVFTTGGIGPTHDDITAPSVAKALDLPLIYDPDAIALLETHYGREGLTEARRLMARVPKGAALIQNNISAAPGFMCENVIVLAGVPIVMQVMLDDVVNRLKVGQKILSTTLRLSHPESTVAAILAETQNKYHEVSIGSYPFFKQGRVGSNIVIRGFSLSQLDEVVQQLMKALEAHQMTFELIEDETH